MKDVHWIGTSDRNEHRSRIIPPNPSNTSVGQEAEERLQTLDFFPFFLSICWFPSFSLSFALFQNLGLPHGLISSSVLVDGDPKLTGTPVRQE